MVVVAFGQIFPASLLDLPVSGCINVHASLLPSYRGAAPIQAAIIAGDSVTGVTTMLMEEGLDTGPILLQRSVEIGPQETAGALAERLAALGAELLVETLEVQDRGDLVPQAQDHQAASVARRLRREDGVVDWRRPAAEIFNLLRGLTPWPGLSTRFREQPLKILWGRPEPTVPAPGQQPGEILGLRDHRLQVVCGDSTVFGLERLQMAGRKPVDAPAFTHGQRLLPGERLG